MLLAFLAVACGPTPTPKCQASNCSGCCTDEGACLGSSKQSFNACGSGGNKCRTCLPQQLCSSQKCVDGAGAGGGDGGGSSSVGGGTGGGGTGGGATGGGAGGGVACGSSGQPCCAGMGTGCLLGLSCVAGTCTSGTGGGAGGGGTGGGAAGGAGGGGGTGGGTAGGSGGGTAGGAGGGAGLGAIGDPCVVAANCASNFCQAFGFQDGYCSKSCTGNGDCPLGSVCGRNPGGGNLCLKSCAAAGTAPGGCRTGYVCEKFQSALDGSPVCFPACQSAASCIGGVLVCDGRGFCCGVNGAACCNATTCDPGNTCNTTTKHCQSLPATNRPAGEQCTGNAQCAGNQCVVESNVAPTCSPNCFSGGYCTQDCASSACPSGSSCSPYTFFGTGKWCVQNCAWDGGQGDCRPNYVCDRMLVAASTQSTCYKRCYADAGCAVNTACDNGFCCGKPAFRCCSGAVKCPGGGTCNALDYCQ